MVLKAAELYEFRKRNAIIPSLHARPSNLGRWLFILLILVVKLELFELIGIMV